MVYFSFVCLLKLILYISKPQNQICDWNIKCFLLFYKNLKSSFLHDSHIWLWGFFTFLVALAHGVASLAVNPFQKTSNFTFFNYILLLNRMLKSLWSKIKFSFTARKLNYCYPHEPLCILPSILYKSNLLLSPQDNQPSWKLIAITLSSYQPKSV